MQSQSLNASMLWLSQSFCQILGLSVTPRQALQSKFLRGQQGKELAGGKQDTCRAQEAWPLLPTQDPTDQTNLAQGESTPPSPGWPVKDLPPQLPRCFHNRVYSLSN